MSEVFIAGTPVVHIDDPTRVGTTTGRSQKRGPYLFVEVLFGTQRSSVREEYLRLHTAVEQTIEQKLADSRFGGVDELRRLLTFEKLRSALHDFVYSMDAARIDFHEYQFKPVLKFVNAPTERLLIADEVGLGKTIEAALIWLEMQARYDARRLLVVCPNMLRLKWRRELREKFGIPAEIGNAENLLTSLTDIRSQGEATRFAWVCSYSALRPFRRELDELDEDTTDLSVRGQLIKEFRNWNADYQIFDLVIFDEAHYMRNAEASQSRLGFELSSTSTTRSVLLVTATPVNNSNRDLFTLLRLLDADFFEGAELFDALLEANRPAVQTANLLGRQPPQIEAARICLESLRGSSFVGGSPLLAEALEKMRLARADAPRSIVEAQESVESVNILGSYISRTRRADVKEKRPHRDPHILKVLFTRQEKDFYDAVTNAVREKVQASGSKFSAFHLTTPQRRMASCIPAVIETMSDDLLDFINDSDNGEESEDNETDASAEIRLHSWDRNYDYEGNDSKFGALLQFLKGDRKRPKVIIFAEFKATLRYLHRRLTTASFTCAIIHGDVPEEERGIELDRFRDDPSVRVLLSSEVGSEGIDLQFCRIIVNYDLPWNPMRIEQRIGRIDRIGQCAERLAIIHFQIEETIEERVFTRLHEKLRIFESSIGDMEAILGEEIRSLTIDLLSEKLTPAQEEQRIRATALAIENRLRLTQSLETEGGSLLAHSDMILDKIGQDRELGRFVSADELRRYIDDFFRRHPGSLLQWECDVKGCFRLELSPESHDRLRDHMRAQKIESGETWQSRKMLCTLHPEIATRAGPQRQRPAFVNHFSPLVSWITYENERDAGAFYEVSALETATGKWPAGVYLYTVQRWTFEGLRSKKYLAYGVAQVGDGSLLTDEESEQFMQAILREGKTWSYVQIDSSQRDSAWRQLQTALAERSWAAREKFIAENSSLLQIRLTQVRNHFARRSAADQRRLDTNRSRGRGANLIAMIEKGMEKLREQENTRVRRYEANANVRENFDEIAAGIVRIVPSVK